MDYTPLTPASLEQAKSDMDTDPGRAYDIVREILISWRGPRKGMVAYTDLAESIKRLYGINVTPTSLWYHGFGRHKGMDIDLALAVLGAIQEDVQEVRDEA